jgi:TonB-dependent receptor
MNLMPSIRSFLPALALAAAPAALALPAGAAEKPVVKLAVKNVTAWPNLQRLPDGTALVFGYDKPSHGQMEGDVGCWASTDGGLTWKLAGTVTKHDPQTNRMNHAAGFAKNGDLVALVGGWTNRPAPGQPRKSDQPFRESTLRPWVSRSSDGGKTWTADKNAFPATIPGGIAIPFGDIKIAANGDLVAIAYAANTAHVLRSTDDGRTWGDPVPLEKGAFTNETTLLRTGGANWLAAARGKAGEGLRLYQSTDDARTWAFKTHATTGELQPGHFLTLADGRILLAYGNRAKGDEGVDAILSSDAGETWGHPVRLANCDGWDSGYPASIQRADGKVITVFYAKSSKLHDNYHIGSVVWTPGPGKGSLTPLAVSSAADVDRGTGVPPVDGGTAAAVSSAPAATLPAVLASPSETVARGIAGQVINIDTNQNIPLVEIAIAGLSLTAVTDENGRFAMTDVPAGTHIVTANYMGLEPARAVAIVRTGAGAWVPIAMHSAAYKMETFTVTGEMEGNAAAITEQRRAVNVTTRLALDTFGTLPNDNIGEVLARMPGIAGGVNNEGVLQIGNIRGTATALNQITVDGDTMQGGGTTERHADIVVLPASLFEEIEIIKAPTPEMRADSLGGNVNIKTVSLLKQTRYRLTNYSVAFRWAPDFYDPTPRRAEHPIHPQLSFVHRQLFDVGKGKKNLALLFGGVFTENVAASYLMQARYRNQFTAHEQEAAGKPVPDEVGVYSLTRRDYYSMLQKRGANFKLEYRLSSQARFHLSGIYADINYPGRIYQTMTLTTRDNAKYDPITGSPTADGHIMPGTTDKITIVEPGSSSHNNIGFTSNLTGNFDRERKIEGGGNIKLGQWDLDFNLNYSRRRYYSTSGDNYGPNGGGTVAYNLYNVGWIMDQRESTAHPKVTQNGGPDWLDLDNYNPTASPYLRITKPDYHDITDFYTARANVRYRFPFSFPLSIKSGVWLNREERSRGDYKSKVYRYNTPDSIGRMRSFLHPDITTTASLDDGVAYPFLDPVLVANDLAVHPERWVEDTYGNTQRYFQSGSFGLTEDSIAGYAQAQFQIKGFRMLGGARYERTTDDVYGYLPSACMSSAEERALDPAGAATRDYGNYRREKGSYDNWFPSVHLVQKISRGLQARLSWSNTIGRPPPSYLYPKETITEPGATTTGRITLNDPSIKPQYSENWDLAIEYYSRNIGQLTVGVFKKDIKDFIYTGYMGKVLEGADNGWGGDYVDYEIWRATNGGKAAVKGLEINYSQVLVFLPGALRGLSIYANATFIKSEGDYDADGRMDDMTLVGFVPRTINAGVKWNYRGFIVSVDGRSQGSYYYSASNNPAARAFTYTRTAFDLSASYQFAPLLTVFAVVSNFTNEPVRRYQYARDRAWDVGEPGPTITFGIRGNF